MVVVRKLKLPRVSRWASPSELALRLELAMRTARLNAVHFALPAAAKANAVIFPGRLEALAALARLHAERRAATEWFWRVLLPAWARPQTRAAGWLALLEAAHSLPEAAIAGAQIFGEAFEAAVEDELLASISSDHAAGWIRAAGWTWPVAPPGRGGESSVGNRPPWKIATPTNEPQWQMREREVIERWATRWPDGAGRLVWLIAMVTVRDNPARAGDPSLTLFALEQASIVFSRARRDPSSRALGKDDLSPIDSDPGAQSVTPSRDLASGSGSDNNNDLRPNDTGRGEKWVTESRRPAGLIEQDAGENEYEIARPIESPPSRVVSSGAGLLFLVPVLERLGFAQFLEANPDFLERGFPAGLLCFVATRAGVPSDDPLVVALAQTAGDNEESFPLRELPDTVRRILATPVPRRPLHSTTDAWLFAVRRWCRRCPRIGLASLVRRSGQLAVTQTQFDIFFDLAAADLRVRRCALDVDPGWVPWLGRIVRFHYREGQL
jgi:hypothetical protein